jgi:tetratricopeptide (TPR) repeat protein
MIGLESLSAKTTRRRASACGFLCGSFRLHGLRLFLIILAAALSMVDANSAASAPYVPADDAQVLERLPTAGNQSLRELSRLNAELGRNPQDLALAIRVATQDIEAGRAESDPRYNGYAEAALRPWLALPNPPNGVLLLRGTLRQAIHDFDGALEDLDQVISAEPRNFQARLTRAIIFQVRGDYPEALKNCRSLALFGHNLVTATCIASVNGLQGEAKTSREALQGVLEGTRPDDESPQVRLWALTVLAEIEARIGDSVAAEQHFRQALSLGLHDGYLLGAYADFLLDARRPQEVLTLLQNELRIDPLLLRFALAEQMVGAPSASRHISDLDERFAMNRLRGDVSHRREEARFALHLSKRASDALRLAEANWAVQREPWDARLLLETALAAGAPSSARPVLDWLKTSHLEDDQIRGLASRSGEVTR